MGLNISMFDVEKTDEGYLPSDWYYSSERGWWDSSRYVGDHDFWLTIVTGEIKWEMEIFEWDEEYYLDDESPTLEREEIYLYRPIDFEEAREWVKTHIHDGNQPRLLEALYNMEARPSLRMSAPGYNGFPNHDSTAKVNADKWDTVVGQILFLCSIAGVFLGAFLGFQHSIFWAVAGGIIGAPLGFYGFICAGIIVIIPYAIISQIIEMIKKK